MNSPSPRATARPLHALALVALACVCVFAAPGSARAASGLTLTSTRTCIRAGHSAVLKVVRAESNACTVTVVAERLSKGRWVLARSFVATRALDETAAVSFRVKPTRGRYRYGASSETASGTVASGRVSLVVVARKVVALTFDGGPWVTHTDAMLKVLKRRDVRATFFMSGYALKQNTAIGRRVVAAGHEVGNHTMNHPDLQRASKTRIRSEINSTQRLINSRLGVRPRWFRPPYGETDSRVAKVCRSLKVKQVLWDADSADWLLTSEDAVLRRVMRNMKPGAVVLMHDGGGNRALTTRVLPKLIAKLRSKGYDFVTMSELDELRRKH